MRTMESVERIRSAESDQAIADEVTRVAAQAGYESWHIAKGAACNVALASKTVIAAWPQAWLEQYDHQRLAHNDAILRSCKSRRHSFHWSDIPIPVGPSKRVMAIADNDFKMRDGFCVPYFSLDGYQGAISFAGKSIDRSTKRAMGLEVVAIFAFNRLNELKANEPTARVLTDRQREVLHWAASGKTAWDTSKILSISELTVKTTLKHAMSRLNVHTRAQAVAKALQLKEIDL